MTRPPPRDPRIPDLVTLAEAADILGVVRQFAHRLAASGQLRGAIIGVGKGKTWVFRRVVVERLRQQRDGLNADKGGDPTVGD